jgi:hypothetical protein
LIKEKRNTTPATIIIHLITMYGLIDGKTNPSPKIRSIPKTEKEIDIKMSIFNCLCNHFIFIHFMSFISSFIN